MPKTPSATAPPKSPYTALSSKPSNDEVINLESPETVHDQVTTESAGTAVGKQVVESSDKNMAEASAKDAMVRAESSKSQAADDK